MSNLTVRIEGMHCTGCQTRVDNRLSEIEGVRSVEADHEAGTAEVTLGAGQEDEAVLQEAIEDLGFGFVDVQRS